MVFTVCDISKDFNAVCLFLGEQIDTGKHIVLLHGNLGAGKTTFVKHFVHFLGGDFNTVDSPTFSLVNTYTSANRTIHHFDLYRLRTADEIEDIGFMEYIESGDLCFVEWPEKIAEFLPKNHILKIDIEVPLETCRKFTFS